MIYVGTNNCLNNAVYCNTSNQILSIPSTALNPGPNDVLSISCWFYISSFGSSTDFCIISNRPSIGAQTGGFNIMYIPSTNDFVATLLTVNAGYNQSGFYYSSNDLKGRWVHLVFTKSGLSTSTYNFYLNGILMPQVSFQNSLISTSSTTTSNIVYINSINGTSTYWCQSFFSTFIIFNKALTSTEVTALYKFPNLIPSTANGNLVAQYKFTEKNGQSFADSSGNGYNGSLVNFTAAGTATSPNPQSGNSVWYNTVSMTPITI